MKKDKKQKPNRELMVVTYLMAALFVAVFGYLVYFVGIGSQKVVNNSYNSRLDLFADRIVRGDIVSSDGDILAMTNVDKNGEERRFYPYSNLFAHAVGYSAGSKIGLESLGNFHLLSSHINGFEQLRNEINGVKNPGDTVVSTLNLELQQIAYDAMGKYQGSVIAMEPATGKILAFVSKPDFNPNTIEEKFDEIINEEGNTSLINRGSQGLYPPGSTFKILTALEYIREHPTDWEKDTYVCDGTLEYGEYAIDCQGKTAHGEVSMREAFAESCNGYFATIGMTLDLSKFKELCEEFGFNKSLPFALNSKNSRFALEEGATDWEILQTAFGQGNTQVTPLHNLMITAAVANGGIMPKPYLIDSIETVAGDRVKTYRPAKGTQVMTADEAAILKELMVGVVNDGSAGKLKSKRYQAAAKTGSAQFDSKKAAHAWMVAFAPADEPQIAVCVLLEEGKSGAKAAGPIVKKIFDAYLAR